MIYWTGESAIILPMEKVRGKWLAAVSGGPDSMALLGMCLQEGIEVETAHVNYHQRKEADEEEAYVRSFCEERGIVCHVLQADGQIKGNFEAAARRIRYDFFTKTVKERNLAGVLTAHQQDDLIETYLMQEEKNLVPEYYGMKEDLMYGSLRVKRPLLGFTKEALETYCHENGIRYYVDSSNLSEKYTRNRIRHQILDHMTPFERDMILREIRQKNAVLQERRCRVKTMVQTDRVLLKQYRTLGEDDRHALLRIIADEGNRHVSLSFLKEADEVLMKKDDFRIPLNEKEIVQDGGSFFLHDVYTSFNDVYASSRELIPGLKQERYRTEEGKPGVFAVTLTEEDYPVRIRSFRPGDTILMRYGHKQVSRFFIDRHIPLYRRDTWPVMENRKGEVILVPGLGCDVCHFSIKPDLNVIEYTVSE